MKKSIVLFSTVAIAAMMLVVTEVISFSAGAPTNASGSPGDNNMTCVQCHASNVNQRLNWITSTELSNGYAPGSTYNMSAMAEQADCDKFGFLITIETSDGTKAGVPVVTDATRTQIQNTHYITHTSAGTAAQNVATWDFQWTAPSSPMGWVTFYGAFIGANGDNQNTGDVVYVSTKDVFLEGTQGVSYQSSRMGERVYVYPNPATDQLHIRLENNAPTVTASLFDLSGRRVHEVVWHTPSLMMMDVSSLTEGVYVLQLQWDNDVATAKVIVSR